MSSAFGAFASFSQFFLYGRRHCTRTGYERARAALLKANNGEDPLSTADASGKVFVVTGANSGVGKEVALFLAKKGATVNMICRSATRGEEARLAIVEESGNDKVVLHVADLSLEADVRSMWKNVAASTSRLDGLVCNAGVLLNERTLTSEGVEVTFACHLLFGTYLLGSLAMPLLAATPGARVIAVSSGGMYNTKWPAWDIATAQAGTYSGNLAYAYAKRGQVLLCERWSAMHPKVKFVSCHPGWTQTPALDAAYDAQTKRYLEPLRSPWEGAEGIAWLCVTPSDSLVGGGFYLDRKAETKHLAGPFFTEGSYTKNSAAEVDEMINQLDAWANGRRAEEMAVAVAEAEGAAAEAAAEAAAVCRSARDTPLRESPTPIDIQKFMGKWYVVAAVPTPFDRGAVNETEEYTWDEDNQRINVTFRMQSSVGGTIKEMGQRATIVNGAPTADAPHGINTRWALSPSVGGVYLPLGLAYLIVDCAPDYSSAIVGTPNRAVVYMMTRTPHPDESTVHAMLATCQRVGYDLTKVSRVPHGDAAQAPTLTQMPVPRTVPGKPFSGPPRLCMATMTPSHNGSSAKAVMDAITEAPASKYATWFVSFPRGSSSPYYAWIEDLKRELPEVDRALYQSRVGWSAPFVWLELPDGSRSAIGGRDELCAWARTHMADEPTVVQAAAATPRFWQAFSYSARPGSAVAPVYADEVAPTPSTAEQI